MENVTKDTINILIKFGANKTQISKSDHWEPLHYASHNANQEKLEAILENLTSDEINSLVYCSKEICQKYDFCQNFSEKNSYSNNALHVLLKHGNRKKDFFNCCKLLIQKGVNVNQADSNGVSPCDLIWKMRNKKFNELLNDKTSRKIDEDSFGTIKLNRIQRFLSLEEIKNYDSKQPQFSSCTILQLSCAKGLTSCVEHLLEKGVNPGEVIPKNPNFPIMIAINEDYEDIVKLLLQYNTQLPESIFLDLETKYSSKNYVEKYIKILAEYLQRRNIDAGVFLNYRDEQGSTALHYATDNILTLLSLGGSLVEKDNFGNTPLESIEPKILEKFFDSNCKVIKNGEKDYDLRINYKSLMTATGPDSEFLNTMIQNPNLNYLTNHPIVAIYLELKWKKFKWLVYFSLFLYFCAYISLLVYGSTFISVQKSHSWLLIFAFALLSFEEILQIWIFRSYYFWRLENYIDLSLLCGLLYLIASGWLEKLNNQNLLVAFSVVFLNSTLGIFMQLGNISFFTVKVLLLEKTIITFLKYIAFYSFPLLAFFLCFLKLNDDENNLFFIMFYEIVVMFAGDPDSEYPKQHFKRNPIFGHFIYIVFVIFIGIILQNLLLGLAINDLQTIQNEVQFIHAKERSKYITKVENIIIKKLEQTGCKSVINKFINFCRLFKDNCYTINICSDSKNFYFGNGKKKMIYDQNLITFLQNKLKDSSLKNKNVEESYSLRSLHNKIEELQGIILSLRTEKK